MEKAEDRPVLVTGRFFSIIGGRKTVIKAEGDSSLWGALHGVGCVGGLYCGSNLDPDLAWLGRCRFCILASGGSGARINSHSGRERAASRGRGLNGASVQTGKLPGRACGK